MENNRSTDQTADARKQRARILVVEDEVLIRIIVSDALREDDYEVIEAFNGDEAIDILNVGPMIDLIVSDVRMPGRVDGIALLRFVKQRHPDLPVILTSGHLDPKVAEEEGATSFLGKPYPVADVLRLVATELARSR